jgi:2-polyprenyl-6-methoxyphenol hydroxylase-like FAD-dependent oxidoreductase
MKSIIIGAGIGGSALALGMDKAGLDYVLLEQAPAFGEVGAGIQLSPNAVRILTWLGLGDDLNRSAPNPISTNIRSGILAKPFSVSSSSRRFARSMAIPTTMPTDPI